MGRPFDPQAVLGRPLMAMLASVSPEGPRIAPVWFLWERRALWMPGTTASSSVRRLSADPRAAVEIVDFDPGAGILLHLGLRGRAEVRAMDSALFRRLLAKYLGPNASDWNPWFLTNVARIDDPEGRLIRLAPDSLFTNDVSYFLTGPKYARPSHGR